MFAETLSEMLLLNISVSSFIQVHDSSPKKTDPWNGEKKYQQQYNLFLGGEAESCLAKECDTRSTVASNKAAGGKRSHWLGNGELDPSNYPNVHFQNFWSKTNEQRVRYDIILHKSYLTPVINRSEISPLTSSN